jgi:lysophospholipase L1-like esterase
VPKSRRTREFLIRAGLVLASSAVSLGLMELASDRLALDRVEAEVMRNSEADEPYGNRVRVEDPQIGWFLKGYTFSRDGLTIDYPLPRTYARKKAPGQYRILVLGDSIAEVWTSWNPAERFPQMLEDALNKRPDKTRFEVLNVSVGSYDTAQRAALLEKYLDGFEIDYLVVQHCFNDATGPYFYKGTRQGKSEYVRYSLDIPGLKIFAGTRLIGSALFRALNLAAYNRLGGSFPQHFDFIGRFSERQEESYRLIKEYCGRKGIKLLALMFPHLSDRSDPRPRWWHYQDQATEHMFKNLNIRYYSLYDDFAAAGFERLRATPEDFTHPKPLGHRIAAQKLQAYLEPDLPE